MLKSLKTNLPQQSFQISRFRVAAAVIYDLYLHLKFVPFPSNLLSKTSLPKRIVHMLHVRWLWVCCLVFFSFDLCFFLFSVPSASIVDQVSLHIKKDPRSRFQPDQSAASYMSRAPYVHPPKEACFWCGRNNRHSTRVL